MNHHGYAILRIEHYHDADLPLEDKVIVVRVVRHREDAEREVIRLNRLNPLGDTVYVVKAARVEVAPQKRIFAELGKFGD